jgi:hypothetical protein
MHDRILSAPLIIYVFLNQNKGSICFLGYTAGGYMLEAKHMEGKDTMDCEHIHQNWIDHATNACNTDLPTFVPSYFV